MLDGPVLILTDMKKTLVQQAKLFLESRLEQNLGLLEEMVSINSYTENGAGVDALGRLTEQIFGRFLGFSSTRVPAVPEGRGHHLFLEQSGISSERIAFVSHLDTVFTAEEEYDNRFTWRVDGDRIYGPGVGDIKGGTIMALMILETLQAVCPETFERMSWTVALNAAEERLDLSFTDYLQRQLDDDTQAVLVMEGSASTVADEWPLVVARKGRVDFDITVTGRGAHAGTFFEHGVNAIVGAAPLITRIADLTDPAHHLTVNIGRINGGTVLNRVPHRVLIAGEMRAYDTAVLRNAAEQLSATVDAAAREDSDPIRTYQCGFSDVLPGWPRNDRTDGLFHLWRTVGAELGLNVCPQQRGGLSDGNLLWQRYCTLDGLGPTGRNYHCSEQDPDRGKEQEYIVPSSFVPKALMSVMAIEELVTGGGINT